MADDTWYRSTDWDEGAQEIFFKKLKRARSKKLYCIHVKARILYNTKDKNKMNGAKTLLQEALISLKDEKYDLPNIAETLSRWYLKEEAFANAEKYIRQYFELVNSGKVPRVQKGAKPEELLAELLMLRGSEKDIKEAIALIDDFRKARDEKNNNKAPYVPPYEMLEDKIAQDLDKNNSLSVEDACDNFEIRHSDLNYNIIHEKSQKSLDYLWKHLSESAYSDEYKVSSYPWYTLKEVIVGGNLQTEYREFPGELFSYIPELGAYIGQVLINSLSGKWQHRQQLIKSRVYIKQHRVNPFLIAYYVVYYHFPIKDVMKKLDYF